MLNRRLYFILALSCKAVKMQYNLKSFTIMPAVEVLVCMTRGTIKSTVSSCVVSGNSAGRRFSHLCHKKQCSFLDPFSEIQVNKNIL